ncbi:hypothetical protein DL93DRAFT_2085256 [Clavulina sp. PMI_390]|nr:hypothetical protein DL93DRAFT_2085256 [Clavulina sp. PMI_390]
MEIQWANESLDPASSSSSTTDNFAPRPTAADLRRLQNELEAVSASLHSHLTPSSPAPITSSPPVMSTALASSPKIGREPPRQPRNFVPPVIRRQSYQQDSPQPVPSSPTVSPALRKEREKVGSLERTCEELQREVNATEERIQREKIAVEKLKSELTELEASTPRPRSLSKNEKLKSPRTAQALGSSLSNSRDGFERSATQSQSPQPMDVDTGADSLSASIMGEISSLQAELAAYDSLLASEVTTQAKFVQKRDQLREQDRVRESLQTGKLPNIRTALTTLDTISVGVLAKLKASRLSQHRSLAVKRVGGTPAVAGLKRERD